MTLIAEVRARLAAATPGPWEVIDEDVWSLMTCGDPEIPLLRRDGAIRSWGRKIDRKELVANSTLAAHAPTDLSALCDRIEALEAALRKVEVLAEEATEPFFGCTLEEIRRIAAAKGAA